MGRVVGIGSSVSINPFVVAGGSAALVYDSGTGQSGILFSGDAGVGGTISLDVLIGKSGSTISDFTGPGGQVSVAFGSQAGVVFNSQGQVIGVMTGLGVGAQANGTYGHFVSFGDLADGLGDFASGLADAFGDFASGLPRAFDDFRFPDPGSWFPRDPLVIDLDGNGVDLTSLQSSTAYFDFGADGTREKTGWFGKNDGVLVRDLDGDGQIENLQELLASPTQDVITTLKGLDTNGDSKITSADSIWSSLQIWQDKDSDGITDAGELLSMSSVQLTEINLAAQSSNTFVEGNQVAKTTSVTIGGLQKSASVVFFTTDPANTQFQPPVGYVRNQDTYILPELRGSGVIPTLSYSMSTNQALLTKATQIVLDAGDLSISALRSQIEELVTQWAFSVTKIGIPTINDDPNNAVVINRQHVEVLQQFGGSAITRTITDTDYARLEANYQDLISKYTALFATQSFSSAFMLLITGNQQAQQIDLTTHNFRFLNEIAVDVVSNNIGFDTAQLSLRLLNQITTEFGSNPTIGNFTQNAAVAATLTVVNSLIDSEALAFATEPLENVSSLLSADIPKLIALKYLMAGGQTADVVMLDGSITLAGTQIVAIGGSSSNAIVGSATANLLIGGAGNDTLTGLGGNDTYIYNNGDGIDTIIENGTFQGTADKLTFTGHSFAELKVAKSTTNNDLILTFTNNADQVVIKDGALVEFEKGVDTFGFTGSITKTIAELRALSITQKQTTGADTIVGFNSSADTFTGGAGNDTLTGLGGNDTYIYNNGDGIDTIIENGTFQGTADKLTFTGHSFAELKVAKSTTNNDLILTFTNNADQVVIKDGALVEFEKGVDTFGFTGSITKTIAELRALSITQKQTTGADTIVGFNSSADTFTGGAGNDTLTGLGGNDTYIYNNGDGIDTIIENGTFQGTADKLTFTGHSFAELKVAKSTTNNDLILTFTNNADQVVIKDGALVEFEKGVDTFGFTGSITKTIAELRALSITQKQTTGADTIVGFNSSADTFTGGAGNDTLTGLGGNDTYIYNNGDGIDTIIENGTFQGTADKLTFTGHSFAELKVAKSTTNNDLILTFTNNADQVVIKDGALVEFEKGVDTFGFTGSITKTIAELRALSITQKQTTGADTIVGFNSSADTFTGGAGNDTLTGLGGNDTYIYNNGDGIDTIIENGTFQGTADKLTFTGHSFAELKVAKSTTNNDLILTFTNNADQVVIKDGALVEFEKGVDTFGFTGSITKTIAELRALSITQKQTTGADTIVGFNSSADTFTGGAGNDTLTGLGGNDRFIFAAGFGKDIITDFTAGSSVDDVLRLTLGADFDTFAEVISVAVQVGSNTVINISANDTITLNGVTKTNLVTSDFELL